VHAHAVPYYPGLAKQSVGRCTGPTLCMHVCRVSICCAWDACRWANKQRQEAQAQLDISLAARTESWKAKLWARKLQHLKVHCPQTGSWCCSVVQCRFV
jgi:hypothetical protein